MAVTEPVILILIGRHMKNKQYLNINDNTCGWSHTAGKAPVFAPLEERRQADWVIVGAGFTGLAAASRIAELNPDDSIVEIGRAHV